VPGFIEHCKASNKRSSPDNDYHGNFNAELFEKWFKRLCISLKKNYGSCIIHLDGAAYHRGGD